MSDTHVRPSAYQPSQPPRIATAVPPSALARRVISNPYNLSSAATDNVDALARKNLRWLHQFNKFGGTNNNRLSLPRRNQHN